MTVKANLPQISSLIESLKSLYRCSYSCMFISYSFR